MILCSVFTLAYSTVDVENFEEYTLSTELNVYDALNDESDSDGVAENILGWLGGLTSGNMSGKILISTPPNADFNEIVFNTTSVTGTPSVENFVYDVYICETGDSSLNASTGFEQCTNTEELISDSFPLSTVWGDSTSGNSIYLNQLYTLESSKSYIIHVVVNNATTYSGGSNAFYTFASDNDAPVNSHECRIIGAGTCTGFSSINDIILKQSDFGSGNFFAESGHTWSCTSNYPSCIQTTGVGTGTASYEIQSEAGNQYLNLFSNGGDGAGYRTVRLEWNHADTVPVTSLDWFTIQTRMRINNYYDTFPSGTTLRNAWGGLQMKNFN